VFLLEYNSCKYVISCFTFLCLGYWRMRVKKLKMLHIIHFYHFCNQHQLFQSELNSRRMYEGPGWRVQRGHESFYGDTYRPFYSDIFRPFYDDTFRLFLWWHTNHFMVTYVENFMMTHLDLFMVTHSDHFMVTQSDYFMVTHWDYFVEGCRTQPKMNSSCTALQNIKNVIYFDILHEQFSVLIMMLWEQSLWYKVLKLVLDTTPGKFFNHEYVINGKLCELWICYVFMLTQCTGILFAGTKCLKSHTEIANNIGEGDYFVEF